MKKNLSISLIRIMAMTMILCDHIILHLQFPLRNLILQVMNSGVLIFVFISGYLYGNKKIENWKRWFQKRVVKICIPVWIFMLIDFLIEAAVWHHFDFRDVFIFSVQMEGIVTVHAWGGGHLWFVTLILICYLITPILQWVKAQKPKKIIAIMTLAIAFPLQIVLAYSTNIGMTTGHSLSWCVIAIGVYIVGYFVGNRLLPEQTSIQRIGIITTFAVVAAVIVLISNQRFDGEIIYDRIIIYYGLLIIDFWICAVLYWIGERIRSNKIKQLINHFDSVSYEIYIVHVLVMNLFYGRFNTLVYIMGTLVFSYFTAWALHFLTLFIQKQTSIIVKQKRVQR